MIFQNAAAFYLFALAAGVVLLYFLRARSKRYDVSSLFLWEGLRNDTHSRAAWLHRRIDPLLILQLLALAFLIFALSEPAWRGLRSHLSGMAIVLDGSASMRTLATENDTRYDLAREEGMALLKRYPETPVTILQLSSLPQVLLPLTKDHETAQRILAESEPTWYASGTSEQLQTLLESQARFGTLERIVLLTDRTLDRMPPQVEEIRFGAEGENVAITHFNVRENPDQEGVTALITVQNYTSFGQQRTVTLENGLQRISASAVLPAGESHTYILPLSEVEESIFTASLKPQDVFPPDDIRYFSVKGRLDRRVRWIGKENRYLLAALNASHPIVLVPPEDPDPVDLMVVYDGRLSGDARGNILLIHAELEGVVTLGEEREGEPLATVKADDPLLKELDISDFRVLSSPHVSSPQEGTTVVLAYGESPLLLRIDEQERAIVLIAPDLMNTNLPLTVDFPLLVRNILANFVPFLAPVTYTWSVAGELIDLSEYGELIYIEDPNLRPLTMTPGGRSFTPEAPGMYTITTDHGSYPVAVNVDPSESTPSISPISEEAVTSYATSKQASTLFSAWPYAVVMALLALIGEAIFYYTGGIWRWHPK